MRRNIRTLILIISAVIGVIAFQSSTFGQCDEDQYFWKVSSGNWSEPNNWQHSIPDPCWGCVWAPGVPSAIDTTWIKNGGTSYITGDVTVLSHHIESNSTVKLLNGSLTVGEYAYVDYGGQIEQSGGLIDIKREVQIGKQGSGTFIQTGGKTTVEGVDAGIVLGWGTGSYGRYELSGAAELSAKALYVGNHGEGIFIQTGGKNTVVGGTYGFIIGNEIGSNGRYELTTGTLVTDKVLVGREGTGSFVVDGGIINGTNDSAEIRVCGSKASLTGPGTFNIKVKYESNAVYGTDHSQPVSNTFQKDCLRMCMKSGVLSDN